MSILLIKDLITRQPGANIAFFQNRSNENTGKKPAGFYNINQNAFFDQNDNPGRIGLGWRALFFWRRRDRLLIRGCNKIANNKKEKGLMLLKKALNINSHADIAFLIAIITDKEDEKQVYGRIVRERINELGTLFSKYNIKFTAEMKILAGTGLRIVNDDTGFKLFTAEILVTNGDIEKAIELLESSGVEENFLVKIFLSRYYIIEDNIRAAIDRLQQVENADLNALIASLLLAIALRKQELLTAAITVLRKIRRNYRKIPPGLNLECSYQLAKTMEEKDNLIRAREEYEKIAAENYDYADVQIRLRKLKKQEA